MGQRLNLEIVENGEVLANAYYHWSGYTSSSLELAQEVLNNLDEVSHENKIIYAVKLLETTQAGLTDEEKEYLLNTVKEAADIKFAPCLSRNHGLIAVSSKGIEDTRAWEEARVTIDLATKTVWFAALFSCSSIEEFAGEDSDEEPRCPVYDEEIDLSSIPFEKFSGFNSYVTGLLNSNIYGFQTPQGKIYGFIA